MGNVQGRRHKRKSKRGKKTVKVYATTPKDTVDSAKLVFVDRDDGEYVWETHVIGRLPFKEPLDYDIVFHKDKLWQDDTDGWSLLVLAGDDDYSDIEV
jgi:hypothetical protein